MSFLHGDDRIYNNIFIQNWPVKPTEEKEDMGFIMHDNQLQGTSVFDDFPTYEEWISHFEMNSECPNMFRLQDWHFAKLPVWINGNAYLNGAKAWKKENDKIITEGTAFVKLTEQDGTYTLTTNVYDLIGSFQSEIISSEKLGEAFEPAERFENPDGTDIVFTQDYFGAHRGTSALPGPFAESFRSKTISETTV